MQHNQKAMAYLMAIDKNASKMIEENSIQKNTKVMTCQWIINRHHSSKSEKVLNKKKWMAYLLVLNNKKPRTTTKTGHGLQQEQKVMNMDNK